EPGEGAAGQHLGRRDGRTGKDQDDERRDQPGEGGDPQLSRSCRYSTSLSIGSRSCSIESRSRTVTWRSVSVSKSTVTQYGVPTSSCRRYRRPMDPASSYEVIHSGFTRSWTLRASGTRVSLRDSGSTATLIGASCECSASSVRFSTSPFAVGASS